MTHCPVYASQQRITCAGRKEDFMKFKKLVSVLCVAAMGLGFLAGCTSQSVTPQTVNVAALAGPTGMGMAQMVVDGVDLGEGVTTEFTVATAPDQLAFGQCD